MGISNTQFLLIGLKINQIKERMIKFDCIIDSFTALYSTLQNNL
jgi:hypothetical protein